VIAPHLAPVVEARRQHLVGDERWHVDETRWMVWSGESAETHRRWYLWVLVSPTAAWYGVDPRRSAQVPKGVLGEAAGMVISDRYRNGNARASYWPVAGRLSVAIFSKWPESTRPWSAGAWPGCDASADYTA